MIFINYRLYLPSMMLCYKKVQALGVFINGWGDDVIALNSPLPVGARKQKTLSFWLWIQWFYRFGNCHVWLNSVAVCCAKHTGAHQRMRMISMRIRMGKLSAAISKKTTMDSLSLTTRSSVKYKVFCILCIQLSISDHWCQPFHLS